WFGPVETAFDQVLPEADALCSIRSLTAVHGIGEDASADHNDCDIRARSDSHGRRPRAGLVLHPHVTATVANHGLRGGAATTAATPTAAGCAFQPCATAPGEVDAIARSVRRAGRNARKTR